MVLGPNAERFEQRVRHELFEGLRDLDLDPGRTWLCSGRPSAEARFEVQHRRPLVWRGVSFSGGSRTYGGAGYAPGHGRGTDTFVESLEIFDNQIPERLRSAQRHSLGRRRALTGDILKAFGLTRDVRQAFISYKRTDSAGIAKQLAHTLFDRGYQVFLDTASVEYGGVPFQDVLKDRLANIDLVVLLDSPNALKSEWVREELTMVNQLAGRPTYTMPSG